MGIKKNKLILISIILIIFSVLAGCTSKEELIAKVNDEGITKIQFEENFQIQKMIIEPQMGPDIWTREMEDGRIFEEVLRESILQNLIKEALIMQEAKDQGIEATEEEIEAQVDKMKIANGGEENFKKYLDENGVSEEYIRDAIKRGIIVGKYRESIIGQLDITEEKLREFFNNNKEDFIMIQAQHILVETKEEAELIIEELNGGKDFSELAQEKSIEPGAATSSGELGYFPRGEMVSEFEDAAFALETGNISEPVKSDYGYHIIKVVDKMDQYEDLKDQVNYEYKDKKFNEKIEELRAKAQIKTDFEKE